MEYSTDTELDDIKILNSYEEDYNKIDLNKIYSKFENMKIEYNNKINELNNRLNETTQILNKTLIELENLKNNLNQNSNNNQYVKNNQKNNKKVNSSQNIKIKENTKKNNKTFKSASLVFIDDGLGYLLCNEYRYKEKSTLIHPIGGKVETYDKGLLDTAIREFVEETNLEQYPYIHIDKSDKNKLIENIKMIIRQDVIFYDLCVGKEFGYYHRFYSYNLKNIKESNALDEFKKSILELPIFFNGNYKTEVDTLEWFSPDNKKINDEIDLDEKKISHLTKMFFKYKH